MARPLCHLSAATTTKTRGTAAARGVAAQKDNPPAKAVKHFGPQQHLQLESQQTRKLPNKNKKQNINIAKAQTQAKTKAKQKQQQLQQAAKISSRWLATLSNGGNTKYLAATNNSQVSWQH